MTTTDGEMPPALGPIALAERQLGAWSFALLWGDLGIGLLVLLAGSLLVPALSLPQALGAILVGSVIGVTLLGLTGIVGSRTGVPTMVCLRPALGRDGSYVATAINVVQLLGWTVFELVITSHAASAVARGVTGLDAAGHMYTERCPGNGPGREPEDAVSSGCAKWCPDHGSDHGGASRWLPEPGRGVQGAGPSPAWRRSWAS